MKIKVGEIGKVLKIFVQSAGAVKDLTGYTATLRCKGIDGRIQADRSTSVTAATGLVSYTTVAGDWLAATWLTPGVYACELKLTKSTTNLHDTHTFFIEVVDNFKD